MAGMLKSQNHTVIAGIVRKLALKGRGVGAASIRTRQVQVTGRRAALSRGCGQGGGRCACPCATRSRVVREQGFRSAVFPGSLCSSITTTGNKLQRAKRGKRKG